MPTTTTDLPPTPRHAHPLQRLPGLHGLAALAAATLLAAGCSLPLQSARMALPPTLEGAAPAAFEGLGGAREGRFTLDGELVSFRRMGDRLSLFERVQLDRVSVEFQRGGAQGRCDGRASTLTAGIVDTPARPLALGCRFSGAQPGELTLHAPRLAAAGTRQAREGQARFGGLLIDIRSEHALAGSPLPLPHPAGYRFMHEGRDIAALDLAGGTPVLHRAAGLDEATRTAVTQVALALGLLFDPAVTAP